MADTNRIAKNTFYLYSRMLFVMAVSLYTSRVVLDKLGIDNYGLFNAVASVIGMMAFLNQTLSSSTSRFLTFELGSNDINRQNITFSTVFYSHIILAGIVVFFLETVGLWYLNHKFVIPEGREWAIGIVYQLSIITTIVSVCVVPFSASIIAHENMSIYAWGGIIEVLAKLLIAFLLSISPFDKMVFYAILFTLVHFAVNGIYLGTCLIKYKETRCLGTINKEVFKKIFGFSGWTAVANLSNTMTIQGTVLLMNLFFSPAVIAAKAIADQVTIAISGFYNNFRTAMNPQIIKTYAAEQYEDSKRMTLKSMVLSFYLLLILGLPLIFTIKAILDIWLVEIPPYASHFVQLAILCQIFNVLPSSTYISFVASGKIKSNAIYGIFSGFSYFVVLYFIYKLGGDVLWCQYLSLLSVFVWILLIRPYLLHKELGFEMILLFRYYWCCLRVFFPSIFLSLILYRCLGNSILEQGILLSGVFILTLICVFLFMERNMKQFVFNIIKKKIRF